MDGLGPARGALTPSLVLASTSRYRRLLLERLGLPFAVADPEIDEGPVQARVRDPHALSSTLARAKAAAVASRRPESIVLGSDQCVAVDGVLLGKPGTVERAIDQLMMLQGRSHALYTAVCVIGAGGAEVRAHLDVTTLTMRALQREQVASYVGQDAPVDCAGGYKIERAGIALFSSVATEDPTAIEGLPLIAVTRLLDEFGVPVFAAGRGG